MPRGIYDRSISKPRKPHTEETKRKMSESSRGRPGPKQSTETIARRVAKLRGQKRTTDARKRMSEARNGWSPSPETREKFRLNAIKRFSVPENVPAWKGGVSKEKGYSSFCAGRRRVKKLGNGGRHTRLDWEELKRRYRNTCPCCLRKEPEIRLTEDHILPVVRGGTDDISNIQPLCRNCNSRKQTKLITYNLWEYI